MTTRAQIVTRAFAAFGLSVSTFDAEPDEVGYGLDQLDAMMASYPFNLLDYAIGEPRAATIESPPEYDHAIVCNLAIRIAPSFGKMPTGEVKRDARFGWSQIAALANTPVLQRPAGLRGAGNRWGVAPYPYPINNPSEPDGSVVVDDGVVVIP